MEISKAQGQDSQFDVIQHSFFFSCRFPWESSSTLWYPWDCAHKKKKKDIDVSFNALNTELTSQLITLCNFKTRCGCFFRKKNSIVGHLYILMFFRIELSDSIVK